MKGKIENIEFVAELIKETPLAVKITPEGCDTNWLPLKYSTIVERLEGNKVRISSETWSAKNKFPNIVNALNFSILQNGEQKKIDFSSTANIVPIKKVRVRKPTVKNTYKIDANIQIAKQLVEVHTKGLDLAKKSLEILTRKNGRVIK